MPPPPKRPAPPAPDPNWELEFEASGRDSAPTPLSGGRDEMLAHALLRGAPRSPARAPLDSIDELGDLESRATQPPPEEMANHVARMMAEAELLEFEEEEGDRPTMEVFEPTIESYGAKLPATGATFGPRAPAPPVAKPAVAAAAKPPVAAAPRLSPQPFPAVRPAPAAPVRMSPQPFPAARPAPAVPVRMSPQPFPAARPAPAVPARMSPQPFPATRPSPGARPSPATRPSSSAQLPAVMGPSSRETPAPRPPVREQPVLELPDLSELPAVFTLEGWGIDEPVSEAAISPSFELAPTSPAAISAPFGALELPELLRDPEADKVAAIETRFTAGDYNRALVLAETALAEHPQNAAMKGYAESCRDMLYKRYVERLGAATCVPMRAMQNSALTGLAIDHRTGFLLSCVDGVSTIEEIIDVSAMPKLEAVRILYELVQEGVIEMASPR